MNNRWLSIVAGVALFAQIGCGGRGTGADPGTTTKELEELTELARNSVLFVAVNDKGVYWTDGLTPGVFAIGKDGSERKKLSDDFSPDALTVTGNRLLWRSYVSSSLAEARIATCLDDGSGRVDLFSGPTDTVGTWTDPWVISTDGQYAYWRSATTEQRILRSAFSPGNPETVYSVASGPIFRTVWVSAGVVYFNDPEGVHGLNPATNEITSLTTQELYISEPVFIGDALYFVGGAVKTPTLSGVFRLSAGQISEISPVDMTAGSSRIAADGSYLYILDSSNASTARILRYDTRSDTSITIREFPGETASSNIAVDGDHLVFALASRLMRISKDPSQ